MQTTGTDVQHQQKRLILLSDDGKVVIGILCRVCGQFVSGCTGVQS